MLEKLNVKVFADGADISGIRDLVDNPVVKGFTTNPTLMRQAGIVDYVAFAREVIAVVRDRPLSLEVFSDDFTEMVRQARLLGELGENVYVKIPVTNTQGVSSRAVVEELVSDGVRVNVTAVFTLEQIDEVVSALDPRVPAYISVFAGRIADAGIDPIPTMASALNAMKELPFAELIWASPREVLNIVQAAEIGCDIITVTHDLLKKAKSLGKDLALFSKETVEMFATDAKAAGYVL